jgi:hypothetical protein
VLDFIEKQPIFLFALPQHGLRRHFTPSWK